MCRVHARSWHPHAAAAYFSRICSSHWNRWSAKSAFRFISRRSGRPVESVIPLSVHFARFFAPSESAAPFVARTSHASSHGVIHLSTRSCSHSMRIRIRRPDAWRTAISLCRSALFFSFCTFLSRDTCAKSESGKETAYGIGYYPWQSGDEPGEIL